MVQEIDERKQRALERVDESESKEDTDLADVSKRKEVALEKIEQTKTTSEGKDDSEIERPQKVESDTQSKRMETLPEKELPEIEEETSEDIQKNTKSEFTNSEAEAVSKSTKEDLEPYKDDDSQEIRRKDIPDESYKLEHETKHESSEPLEKEQSEVVEAQEDRKPIRTEEEYEQLRERHPYVEDMPRWAEIERRKDLYMHVKEVQRNDEIPDMTLRDWARELDTSYSTLRSYLEDEKQSEAFDILDRNEEARKLRESKLAPEAFEHRIDPSEVYHHFKHLKDIKEHSPEDLAVAIEKMYQSSEYDSRMQWAELRPYHTGGPKWMRDIAKSIEQNREEVESELNRRMGLENNPDERMRLGLVDSKLYMRRQDTNEYSWMNMYRNELVYFRSQEEKKAFVEEARDRMGIQGNRRLSQLVEQVTDRENITDKKHSQPVYDLTNESQHLRGYSLGMMLDTNNQRIQDIKPKIERIGKEQNGGHGIENPQFPEGEERIDSMYASMLGAGLSDGHIERTRDGFVYTESNRKRVEIFNKQVDQFGEVYRHESVGETGVIRTRYSSTFGRLLETRGLTKGDKTLQNEGWPDWMKKISPTALADYYGALWAEDGSFVTEQRSHRAVFRVDRGTVLRDPNRNVEYGTKNKASEEMAKLVRDHGDESVEGPFGGLFKLNAGKLEELENSSDAHISLVAQKLREIVEDNKPQLMMDEQEGLEKLGIKTSEYFLNLTYSNNTERLSALWGYQTSTKDDAMRVATKCPPDDEVKRGKVEKWMRSEFESVRRERVQREIGGIDDEL